MRNKQHLFVLKDQFSLTKLGIYADFSAPENAYLLTLEPAPKQEPLIAGVPVEKERLVWNGTLNKKPVKYYNDGNAGFWRRLGSNLVSYFPIEGYL